MYIFLTSLKSITFKTSQKYYLLLYFGVCDSYLDSNLSIIMFTTYYESDDF